MTQSTSPVDSSALGSLVVVGLGYIGLPTAAMFASTGFDVTGVDISERAVEAVNSGTAHIEEGELDELVEHCVNASRLRARTSPVAADNFIIAVPTPVGHDASRTPDVSYIRAAGASIAPCLKKGDLVILESTSPVGTTRMLAECLPRHVPTSPSRTRSATNATYALPTARSGSSRARCSRSWWKTTASSAE